MRDLQGLSGGNRFGVATLADGAEVPVEFTLDGDATQARLHFAQVRTAWLHALDFLPLTLPDGTRLTFVDNVLTSATRVHPHGSSQTLMPHFVAAGAAHVDAASRFRTLTLRVADAPDMFTDFDAFSTSLDPEGQIDALLAEQERALGRTIARGESPIVAWFTGRHEIVAAETAIGHVSVNHRPSYTLGGASGVRIANAIHVDVELPHPLPMGEALDSLLPLLRFLQLVAGRPQRIEQLWGRLEGEARLLEILWCMAPGRDARHGERLQPRDLPLNGGYEPEDFARVMAGWLALDAARRDARVRFAGVCARGNRYDIDRLVGAANMFDILPADAAPRRLELPADVEVARQEARRLFKALPLSPERDRALGDLGRLGTANLKSKVRHRAALLRPAVGDRLPDLEAVLDRAVDARNHYVHGSGADAAAVRFQEAMGPFYTSTLEFVFGVSELIEAGWDFARWASYGTTMSHPWGSYRVSYAERLAAFRAGAVSAEE